MLGLKSFLNKVWHRVLNSAFAKSFAILASGTILAQFINVAVSPILTRIYTPEDFGIYAIFLAIIGSISPVVCANFQSAIVVSRKKIQAQQLLGISILAAASTFVFVLLIFYFFQNFIEEIFKVKSLDQWMLFVPLVLLFTGITQGLYYYSNWLKEYKIIAYAKIILSLSTAMVSIVCGVIGFHNGLILASAISTIVIGLWLMFHYRNIFNRNLLSWNRHKSMLVWKFRSFPVYGLPAGLVSGLTASLPVFFLMHYFSESVVGYYILMIRVALTPLRFIAISISQVNLKKVSELVHQNKTLLPYLLKITSILVIPAIFLSLVLIIIAPYLFAVIFGETWRIAGTYLQILMPSLALKFVVGTLSTTIDAAGYSKLSSLWKISVFIITFITLYIVAPLTDVTGMLIALLINDIFLYAICYILIIYTAKHPLEYK